MENKLYNSLVDADKDQGGWIYEEILRRFFQGEESNEQINTNPLVPQIGHLWIATHKGFDTLTWEPYYADRSGPMGQYEIAVRIKTSPVEGPSYIKYPGYVAGDGYLNGRGAGGH